VAVEKILHQQIFSCLKGFQLTSSRQKRTRFPAILVLFVQPQRTIEACVFVAYWVWDWSFARSGNRWNPTVLSTQYRMAWKTYRLKSINKRKARENAIQVISLFEGAMIISKCDWWPKHLWCSC